MKASDEEVLDAWIDARDKVLKRKAKGEDTSQLDMVSLIELELEYQRRLKQAKYVHPITMQPIRTAKQAQDAKKIVDWMYEARKDSVREQQFSDRIFLFVSCTLLIIGLLALIVHGITTALD